MSVVIETFLICDFRECGENFGVDNRNQNVKQQRIDAKANGWKYVSGKDFCPKCILKLKEEKINQLLNKINK